MKIIYNTECQNTIIISRTRTPTLRRAHCSWVYSCPLKVDGYLIACTDCPAKPTDDMAPEVSVAETITWWGKQTFGGTEYNGTINVALYEDNIGTVNLDYYSYIKNTQQLKTLCGWCVSCPILDNITHPVLSCRNCIVRSKKDSVLFTEAKRLWQALTEEDFYNHMAK